MLVVGGTLTISGLITANGGNGGNGGADISGSPVGAGGGGGGGGGILALLYREVLVLNGNVTANGGAAGTGGHANGVAGSIGTVYTKQVDNKLIVLT